MVVSHIANNYSYNTHRIAYTDYNKLRIVVDKYQELLTHYSLKQKARSLTDSWDNYMLQSYIRSPDTWVEDKKLLQFLNWNWLKNPFQLLEVLVQEVHTVQNSSFTTDKK